MTQRKLKYGLLMPHGNKALSTPQDVTKLAIAAEHGGWDGFFIWDNLGTAMCDTTVLLSSFAIHTKRIKIGPMVMGVPRRRPTKLAKELITLDQLSNGRIIFGAGLGEPVFYEKFGEDKDNKIRAEKLDEALDIIAQFLSEEEVNYEGKHFKVDGWKYTGTVQKPRVPIWVGGMWPRKGPFKRAAKWDGVIPHTTRVEKDPEAILSVDEVKDGLKFIEEHRDRDVIDFSYAILNPLPDDEKAKLELVEKYHKAGVKWWVDSVFEWKEYSRDMESLKPLIAKIKQGPPNY